MSTAFFKPPEPNFPLPGMPSKQCTTKSDGNLEKSLRSQLLSLSGIQRANLAHNLSEASEDDLISVAQLGNQQAFMELCGRYSPVTRQKIFKIVRNHEDTEDALQDTLLRAYTHLSSFRRSCKFATWLTAIGVNTSLMILRKRRIRKESSASPSIPEGEPLALQEPVDWSPGPEKIYLKQQATLLVRRELKKLKPSLRSIVDYYYGTGCSLDDVAKVHGFLWAPQNHDFCEDGTGSAPRLRGMAFQSLMIDFGRPIVGLDVLMFKPRQADHWTPQTLLTRCSQSAADIDWRVFKKQLASWAC
jgi:RNA polymerase sigma-70 factor (ECF subfamily)